MLSSQISKSPFLVIYTEISIYQSKFSNDFFLVIYTKIQNFFTFMIYTYFVDVTGLHGTLQQNRAPGQHTPLTPLHGPGTGQLYKKRERERAFLTVSFNQIKFTLSL